jgi:glyoxylase-like metal-dependent hydrolase (beta-lactamase superfamily II)
LPGGNDPLPSLSWQPVPGAVGAQVYPFIRKIDTISSNSYLIETPDAIILIDPGGLPEQVAQLASVIQEVRSGHDRPLFVLLTHAHIDHFFGVQSAPAFAHPDAVVFAVQEAGAVALECGDRKLTQADLLGQEIAPMKIGLHLLTKECSDHSGIPVACCFANGASITVVSDRITVGSVVLVREQIRFGPGTVMEFYHTPGHSPDSICIRLGDLLFIGDILFAANPGIAGICGWDQASLISSLDGIQEVLIKGGITLICPGHGRIITAADADRMFSAIRTDALALENIAELNSERAIETARFAEDCMDQVNELFTIMAGRLYYVSYMMDELGESGIAEQMGALISSDRIDELLDAFRAFAEEHHREEQKSIHLALKAGQVIAKLERSFKKDELLSIIDPTLVQRASRLLSDYTTMLRGFCPPSELTECDLTPVIEALVTGLSVSSCTDEDVLSSADDDAAFAQILLARIGTRPLLDDIAFTLKPDARQLVVSIDRDHFSDLLTYIFEELVGTGSDRIVMHIQSDDRQAIISISGNMLSRDNTEKQRTWRFLQRLSERTGGSLSCSNESGMRRFTITVGLM